MIFILFVTLFQVVVGERLICDQDQFAERGKPFILSCNATESITDVYWYKGVDTSDLPILASEDGNQGGTEYQKEEYELTSKLSLKIIETQVKHEGIYTVRIYFHDYLYEEATTSVRVYDRPSPPCPYVDVCGLSCNGCEINVNTSGYLICYVNGSRPDLNIDWSVDKTVGISSAIRDQLKRYDEKRDKSYTNRTISYNVDRCGTTATFRCMVEATAFWSTELLETYVISVKIKSGDCEIPSQTSDTSLSKVNLTGIWIALAIVLVLLIIFLIYLKKRKVFPNSQSFERLEMGATLIEENKKTLITNLMTEYEKRCFVKLLPWEKPIHISTFYTASGFTMTPGYKMKGKENERHIISSDLLEMDFISQNSRLLLVADFGYGKTSFTKYFLDKWNTSQAKENERGGMNRYILIQIHLKYLKGDELLSDIIRDTFCRDRELTSEEIDGILRASDCIVVLSGLDEMSMNGGQDSEQDQCSIRSKDETSKGTSQSRGDGRSTLTIGNLLHNTYHSLRYQKLTVWVTSNNNANTNSAFGLPYCRAELQPFTEKERKTYINKLSRYYVELHGGCEFKSVVNEISKLIGIDEIFQEISETPLLLMMIVYVTANRLIDGNGKYENVKVNKLTAVMNLIMRCLETNYLDKFTEKEKFKVQTLVQSVKFQLGKLAFENQDQDKGIDFEQKLGKDYTKSASEIGFLKYSDKVDVEDFQEAEASQSSSSRLVFYHEFFKAYLAARYILESNQESDLLNKYLEKSNDEDKIRILQFMCGLEPTKVHHLLKIFWTKRNMWNNLIDCLYEINDVEQKNLIYQELKREQSTWMTIPVMNIRYLKKKYHKEALADFCKFCRRHNVRTCFNVTGYDKIG